MFGEQLVRRCFRIVQSLEEQQKGKVEDRMVFNEPENLVSTSSTCDKMEELDEQLSQKSVVVVAAELFRDNLSAKICERL